MKCQWHSLPGSLIRMIKEKDITSCFCFGNIFKTTWANLQITGHRFECFIHLKVNYFASQRLTMWRRLSRTGRRDMSMKKEEAAIRNPHKRWATSVSAPLYLCIANSCLLFWTIMFWILCICNLKTSTIICNLQKLQPIHHADWNWSVCQIVVLSESFNLYFIV